MREVNQLDTILMLENDIYIIINDVNKSQELLNLLRKKSVRDIHTYEYYLLNARADLLWGMSVDDIILRSK